MPGTISGIEHTHTDTQTHRHTHTHKHRISFEKNLLQERPKICNAFVWGSPMIKFDPLGTIYPQKNPDGNTRKINSFLAFIMSQAQG